MYCSNPQLLFSDETGILVVAVSVEWEKLEEFAPFPSHPKERQQKSMPNTAIIIQRTGTYRTQGLKLKPGHTSGRIVLELRATAILTVSSLLTYPSLKLKL